ncbi:MAG: arginine--tRNA ligase [Nanoarchaeota archaeon]
MEKIKELIGINELKFSYPYSHFAFPKFILKKYGKEEDKFIEELKNKESIEKVWEENNFINIIFNEKIIEILENKKKETNKKELKNITYLVEHTSNNPTGPLHIGRVRSTFIGDFLANALEFLGYKVKRHFYVNDLGKQIALILLGKEKKLMAKPEKIKAINEYSKKYLNREDYQTFLIYVKANEEYQVNEEFKKEVDSFLKKAEENEELLKKLKETAEFALKGIKKTFERLNVKFDSFDYESSFLDDTKKYLEIIAKKLNLKEHPYVVNLKVNNKEEEVYLTRQDGTTTYLSRDIAYHKYKEKLADKLINVLGEDHKREFLILKELLKIVGFEKELDALFFSFLTLNGQKLSTRKGNLITVDELIDMGKEKIKGNDEQKEKLAIAALKVFLLNTNVNKPIDFRWELALKTEGETGVYLLYTYARINSLIKKSSFNNVKFKEINLKNFNKEMIDLYLLNYLFEENLVQAIKRKNPAFFLNYLFELAKLFNKFYGKEKIINSKEEKEKIWLIKEVKEKFKNAFKIINIPIVEKIEN